MTEGASVISNIGFWTVNFWGILGTLSGGLGLLISYFVFRYNKPLICIDVLELNYPKNLLQYLSDEECKGYFVKAGLYADTRHIQFDLYFNVTNKSGGAGSIQKPKIIIKELHGKNTLCSVEAITRWLGIEGAKDSGRTIYLGGGERMDGEHLEYRIYDSSLGLRLLKDKLSFKYYIGYDDNAGKYHEEEIKTIRAV